jgi:hypothetical protein
VEDCLLPGTECSITCSARVVGLSANPPGNRLPLAHRGAGAGHGRSTARSHDGLPLEPSAECSLLRSGRVDGFRARPPVIWRSGAASSLPSLTHRARLYDPVTEPVQNPPPAPAPDLHETGCCRSREVGTADRGMGLTALHGDGGFEEQLVHRTARTNACLDHGGAWCKGYDSGIDGSSSWAPCDAGNGGIVGLRPVQTFGRVRTGQIDHATDSDLDCRGGWTPVTASVIGYKPGDTVQGEAAAELHPTSAAPRLEGPSAL